MSLKFIVCICSLFIILIAHQSRQSELNADAEMNTTDTSERSGRRDSYVEYSRPVSASTSHNRVHNSANGYSHVETNADITYSQRGPNRFNSQSQNDENTAGTSDQIQVSGVSSEHAESGKKSLPQGVRSASSSHPLRVVTGYEPSQRSHPWEPYHMRGDTYPRDVSLSHSGTNVDWSIWQAEPPAPPADSGDMMKPKGDMPPPTKGPSYHHFHHFDKIWKDDPWNDIPTPMMMNGMMPDMMMKGGMMPDDKKKSLLDKLASLDPMKILLAGAIPLSLILAAILPTLMNMMMMNGNGPPTISTIATGSGGRELEMSMLEPVMKAITDLGSTTTGESYCFQKIFCKVAKGSELTDPVKDVFYKASALVDDRWLEAFGVKSLLDAIADGKCESINCPSTDPLTIKQTSKINRQPKGAPSE